VVDGLKMLAEAFFQHFIDSGRKIEKWQRGQTAPSYYLGPNKDELDD
jgi:hypothetical protein